jgi:hypothetical protein
MFVWMLSNRREIIDRGHMKIEILSGVTSSCLDSSHHYDMGQCGNERAETDLEWITERHDS